MKKTIESIVHVDEKRAAKVETDGFDDHPMYCLLVTNNGYQWSGATMYSIEVMKAAHQALGEFIEKLEQES